MAVPIQNTSFERERGDVGDLSDDVSEMNDRVFDVSLQRENGLSHHIAEFFDPLVVHVGEAVAALLELFCTRRRALRAALLRIGFPFPLTSRSGQAA